MPTRSRELKFLVVEDLKLVRDMLVEACQRNWPDAEVMGATSGQEALEIAQDLQPDIILLDLCLPDGEGLDFTTKFRECCQRTKIIALTAHTDEFTIHRASHLRINGFVDKNEQPIEVLQEAVESVLDGRQYLSNTARRVREEIRFDPMSFSKVLSDREISLLSLLGQGLSNDEIAQRVGLAPTTVKLHRNKIMMRIGVHSTPQLMRYAIAKGFVHMNSPGMMAHSA